MSERLHQETIESRFFPTLHGETPGLPIAPPGAISRYEQLKKDWLQEYPKTPNKEPGVSLSPGEKNGRKGFFVEKKIIYLQGAKID